MILVVTEQQDLTADLVISRLRGSSTPHARLNSDRLLRDVSLTSAVPGDTTLIDESGTAVSLSDVGAVWYRRPTLPTPSDATDAAFRSFAQREGWAHALGAILGLDVFWMNRPDAIWRANQKVLQLRLAARAGLTIPRTLVTRSPNEARDFARNAVGSVVVKPVSHGTLELQDGDRAIYTHRIEKEDIGERLDAISHCPVIMQEEIKKSCDVRLTMIGEKSFAVAIDSQQEEATTVDWRRPSELPLQHRLIELPGEILTALRALCGELGLVFAAIDLVMTPGGEFVFLEVNPNGQWGWIEIATGAKISDAIADCLSEHRGARDQRES